MNYEVADNAKYLYAVWIVVWVGIYIINSFIYKYYEEPESFDNSNDISVPRDAGLLFTLWWRIESKENSKVQQLKKTVNRLSICFGGLTVLSAVVVIYLRYTMEN